MKSIGMARIGKDPELKHSNDGTAFLNLSLAVDYREKNEKKTQWISATLWGKQAEALAPYLVKGTQHCFALSDLYVREYTGANGSGVALQARVDSVELGPKGQTGGSAPAVRSSGATGNRAKPAGGFDDMDSDVPF